MLTALAKLPADRFPAASEFAAAHVIRFALEPGPGSQVAFPVGGIATYLALSPDGRQAVYASRYGGSGWSLDIRRLDQLHARTLPGTEGASHPEFSPEGRWIAFGAADGSLKKVAVDGTALTTLCALDASGIVGLTWISDREIVFTPTNLAARGLWRVPADGGQPVMFTQFDSATGERLQLSPRTADQGRLVFYSSTQASNLDLKVAVVSPANGKPKVLTGLGGARVLGLAGGFLLYVRLDGVLMAAPFDTRSLEAGPPLQVLDCIAARSWLSPAALSASGSLLYQRGGLATQLVRVDQRGEARLLIDSARVYAHPRLSPDGRRLAFEVQGGAGNEIWIADLADQTVERVTRDGFNARPEWTPDGSRVLYSSSRSKANSLWWQPADASGPAELVYQSSDAIREGVFTPDGHSIVYRADTPDSNRDVYRLPLTGGRRPVPLLTSADDDKHPRVAPDGKLLAYTSNESGREEVYLRALSGTAARVRVSTGGGGEPLWSPDGRRIYYRAGAALMAAAVAPSPTVAVTGRDMLFEGHFTTDPWHPNYDVAPDGKSFIMLRPMEENRQLVMVVNWIEQLKRRTARGK